jgi:hypothetical protein
MHRLFPRLLQMLLASPIAIPVVAVAEPPVPAAPAPIAVPYPNTAARDAATGLPTGKRMHKPYTLTAPAAVNPGDGSGGQQTSATVAQPASCAALAPVPDKVASDPEEGGQVARTASPKPTVSDMTVTKRADSASTKPMESSAPASSCAEVQH